MSLLERIAARRRERVGREGPALGASLPPSRRAPAVPFLLGKGPALPRGDSPVRRHPGALICEIKRRSPSRGDIAPGLDAVAQAGRYAAAGVRFLSVLTEEDHFGGSLRDLIAVKERFPDLAVLRNDFPVAK